MLSLTNIHKENILPRANNRPKQKYFTIIGDQFSLTYNSKTSTYNLAELESVSLKKIKKTTSREEIAFIILSSIGIVAASFEVHVLFSCCLLLLLPYIYYKRTQAYYLLLRFESEKVWIRVKEKHKVKLANEITPFLDYLFTYKTNHSA
jgi:hypothetical protein